MQEVIIKTKEAVNNVTVVPVITTPPYTAGDAVGAVQPLLNVRHIHSLCILDKSNQKAAFDILLFSQSPTAATITDNTAFAWSTDDQNLIARIAVATGDYVTVAGEAVCQKSSLDLLLHPTGSDSTIYAAVVTSGTPTYAVGALKFIWGALAL